MLQCFAKAFICITCILTAGYASGQPPKISYTTPNIFYVNRTIPPLVPANAGGAVFNYGLTVTLAGKGTSGADDGNGTAASFNLPLETALDAGGNVYVADAGNHLIRKISPQGTVTTFAGTGKIGSADGVGTSASFNHPAGLVFDGAGNLYVADEDNQRIRKITPAGVVTTFAGSGSVGAADGFGTSATFHHPCGMTIDAAGNLYVADFDNHMIRKITPAGLVSTFAGTGNIGSADGPVTTATFNYPISVTADAADNIYVADRLNHKIRKVTQAGLVSTVAGSGNQGSDNGAGATATFNYPTSITIDSRGYLFVVDKNGNNIRRITPEGVVGTVAGKSGAAGFTDGPRSAAMFSGPFGIISDGNGYVYVADYANNAIRKVVSASYLISPTVLPTGLSFDEETGIISGTPVTIWPETIYTVTAFNKDGSSSTPVSITVIEPTAVITAGNAAGFIHSCLGTESEKYQQIRVSATGLTSPVTVTAPAGFEVAANYTGPYSQSIVTGPASGDMAETIIFVKLSALAPAGTNKGDVEFSSAGAFPVTVAVNGIVNPVPCSNSVTKTLFAVPNTFTPNADGINDVWDMPALAAYPDCTVRVYNRYGSLVYGTKGYAKPWNGTQNGLPLPAGVYYYIILPVAGAAALSGYITIIR